MTGVLDQTGIMNLQQSTQYYSSSADAYFYPCLLGNCSLASDQIKEALNALSHANVTVKTLWLDITFPIWTDIPSDNQQLIRYLVVQAQLMNVKVGIFTNKTNWAKIVGVNWDGASHLPLWETDWNGRQVRNHRVVTLD
uniref:Uncharacterized protein n=1 Tax=Panagrolaimus davidi TaxID=227884 RepID=A0A914QSR1_9BILA